MITAQARDIFSSVPVDGFDKILFAFAALVAAAAWHPEVVAYLRRAPTHPNAEEIRDRPLGTRTTLVSICGGLVVAGILTAIAPRRSVFALILATIFVGAACAASAWTALILVPLGRTIPEGDPPGAVGTMLRRFGRNPWQGALKALMWSAAVGIAMGAIVALYRNARIGDSTHALALVELCTIGALSTGYVLSLATWARSVGEYARDSVVPPNVPLDPPGSS